MLGRALNHLYGYERLRQRGDRHFLARDFEGARRAYLRARSVLRESDYRVATLDALVRECEAQMGISPRSVSPELHSGIEELFELAIADKPPDRIRAYRALPADFKAGYVALVQGDSERAVRRLTEAIEGNAVSFVAYMELGRALSLAGDMERSREALAAAERSAPDDVEVAILLSAVNIELGRFDEARERLQKLDTEEKESPDVTYLIGRALAGGKRDEAALEKFRETVQKEPRFHEAYFEGAQVLRRGGDREAAFQLLSRACNLAPDEIRYNRELADLVLAYELDPEAGLAACDRLMVTDEENAWQYLHWIAELYIRRGWRREARDPLQKALALVPSERKSERQAIERRLAELDTP